MKLFVAFGALAFANCAQSQPSPDAVMAALREADKKFQSFSISGTIDMPLAIHHPEQGRNLADVFFTGRPDGFAFSLRSTGMTGGPIYAPPGTIGYGYPFRQHADNGSLSLTRVFGQWVVSLPSVNASRIDSQAIVVRTDGNYALHAPRGRIDQVDPHSPLYHYPFDQACFATGRGFARLISDISTVIHSEGGLIRCTATGKDRLGQTGTWILDLDPARDYMARSGEFYPGAVIGPPAYKFNVWGELLNENGFAIAEQGNVELTLGPMLVLQRYRFASFSKTPNSTWFADAENKINERSDQIIYKDYRNP